MAIKRLIFTSVLALVSLYLRPGGPAWTKIVDEWALNWVPTTSFLRIWAPDLRYVLTDKSNEWSINTTISFPGEDGFTKVTTRWSTFNPPIYSASVSPATAEDVITALKLATKYGIPFLATGGRHGYTASLGKIQDGLAIDLSLLDTVEVDEVAGTLTIGGGVRWSQILNPVYEAGFEMQIGSCPCPGMVGATIGGGIGRYSGLFGLIIDALVSVRMVTAEGRLIEVSESSHSDLFWGIRGAGANFGIITSATYQLQKIATSVDQGRGQVLNADFIIPAEMSEAYFKLLESFNESMPANLAVASIIMWDQHNDASQILASWVYIGPEVEGREFLAPVLDLQPRMSSITVVPWNQILVVQGFGMVSPMLCQDNLIRSIYSVNVRHLSAATYQAAFEKMTLFYAQYPSMRGSVMEMETFPNQAAMAVGHDATAYPWRDARGNMMFLFTWANEGDESVIAEMAEASHNLGHELRDDFAKTSGYPDLSIYVSYARSDETLEQIYGRDKLPRLTTLKKAWDPLNVFAYNNALPTEYPLGNGGAEL